MARLFPKMKRWRQIVKETSGSQIAESALVLPLVFLLLIGVYWFGLAFNAYTTINHAAREGARLAMSSSCAMCGNQGAFDTQVANTVTQTLQASRLDINRISPYTPATASFCPGWSATNSCTVTSNIQVCHNVQLNSSSSGAPVCGAMVSFQYQFQFYLPFTSLNMQQISLKTAVQMQGEN